MSNQRRKQRFLEDESYYVSAATERIKDMVDPEESIFNADRMMQDLSIRLTSRLLNYLTDPEVIATLPNWETDPSEFETSVYEIRDEWVAALSSSLASFEDDILEGMSDYIRVWL